jgi:hypothetical protein
MSFWKKIFGEDDPKRGFFFGQDYWRGFADRYGMNVGDYSIPYSDETIEAMHEEFVQDIRDLGQRAVRDELVEISPLWSDELVHPQFQRMHALELRPRVMNAWKAAHQAERLSDRPDRFAVAQGIVELFPRLNEHIESPHAEQHISLSELLQQAELENATLEAITDTYVLANQER